MSLTRPGDIGAQLREAANNRSTRRSLLKQSAAFGFSVPIVASLLAACGEPDDEVSGATDSEDDDATDEPDNVDDEGPDDSEFEDSTEIKIGAELIGELEGPEFVTDELPESFGEAPELTELVNAGELPPVEERIGSQPAVIRPVHEIGEYGGNWRRAFSGPGDRENGNRIVSMERLLFRDYTGEIITPSLARDWELSDDGTTTTIYLREGVRWSDGEPFNAADFQFWFEHLYQNDDLMPTKSHQLAVDGEQGYLEVVDDFTIRFVFPSPYPMFPEVLASHGPIGNGHAAHGPSMMAGYAPAHYLEQFHPDFIGADEADQLAQDAGYDNWTVYFQYLNDWALNVDLPVLTPWKTINPINTQTWLLERNPYFWAVDTEGNQLPYIDTITLSMTEDLEVVTLRAIAGEIDKQGRLINLASLPVLLENQEQSDYTVRLDPGFYGTDAACHFNHSFQEDEELGRWITNRDFRRAFSLGFDRHQLNEALWLGLGTPGSCAPADELPENPGPEYRDLWSTFDPDQANQLLDTIGLEARDDQGFRLRTDNGERLRISITAVGGGAVDWPAVSEMMSQQLGESIGIHLEVREVERSLSFQLVESNSHQMLVNGSNGGSEKLFLWPYHTIPLSRAASEGRQGPEHGHWFATNGTEGIEPPTPMKEAQDLYQSGLASADENERNQIAQEIWKIVLDEVYTVGTVGLSPANMGVRVVKNYMGNIPERQGNANHLRTPGSSIPPTFFIRS